MKADRGEVLLQVWSEVGKHLRLAESMTAITECLSGVLAIDALRLDEFDGQVADLVHLYSWSDGAALTSPPHSRSGLATQIQGLQQWAAQRRMLLLRPAEEPPSSLAASGVQASSLASLLAPLHFEDVWVGVLRLQRQTPADWTAPEQAFVDALLEPLAVAVANDQRQRQIERLSAAASADRETLLARMGRSSLAVNIVGADRGLRQVMQRVQQVAPTDATVLILGETGSGKEVIARAVHDRSARHDGPFVRVNCGAVPPELIDSELFGHEKGSFTGALGIRRGWFERADGGTLFLDEIGELSAAVQVRLLRVLQDGIVQRVGSERDIAVNVRVIAATHRDLPNMVQDGHFREDLWYRLAVFLVILPSLRERQEDLPELAEHFILRAANRLGVPPPRLSARDYERLAAYRWPGNIRELAAVLERAVILAQGGKIEIEATLGGAQSRQRAVAAPRAAEVPQQIENLDAVITAHLKKALQHCRGRVDGPHGAARLLGLNVSTLRAKLRKFAIDPAALRH